MIEIKSPKMFTAKQNENTSLWDWFDEQKSSPSMREIKFA